MLTIQNASRLYRLFCVCLSFSLCCSNFVYSQCKEEKEQLEQFQNEYGLKFKALEGAGNDLQKQVPDTNYRPSKGHHITVEVTGMKRQEFSFDLVEVTMKEKKMAFDIPQVTMKKKTISYPTTKTEWKITEICCGIKTKTLVVKNYMTKTEFKIPEIRMKRQEIITKIPEFRKVTKKISLDLPQFKMKSPVPEDDKFNELQRQTEAIQKAVDSLAVTGEKLDAEQKVRAKNIFENLFACYAKELTLIQIQTEKTFEQGLLELTTTIAEVKKQGIDPSNMKGEDGSVVSLIQIRADLGLAHEQTIKGIEEARLDLKKQLDVILEELEPKEKV